MTEPNEPTDPWATPAESPAPTSPPPAGAPPPPYGQQPYGQPPAYGQPPYGQPGYYQQPSSTNGFAIASVVLGILGLYWLGSILALVFGYVARRQIRAGNQKGDGIAIAGIVLGWIGVGLLVLFFFIGFVAGFSGAID